jgi:hypothetical protein
MDVVVFRRATTMWYVLTWIDKTKEEQFGYYFFLARGCENM